MHEMSTCRRILDQVSATLAKQADAGAEPSASPRITRIQLSVGELARVDTQELVALFPVAALGTPAEGARLEIITQPVRIECRHCGQVSNVSASDMRCPLCATEDTVLVAGTDMVLTGIDYART